MKKSILKILALAFAVTFAVLPVAASRAAAAAIDFPSTSFAIKMLGDTTLVQREGELQALVLRDQKLAANDVYVGINGIPYTAYVLLGSDLTLLPGTTPLKFEHKGTLDFTINGSKISLEYVGAAIKTKDMATNAKTLNSYGDFEIVNGTGAFAGLVGAKGTYTLTLVCRGIPGEHPKVGSLVDVTFSAKGM